MLRITQDPKLPKEISAAPVRPQLLAQAVRVYLANQRQGTQNAKTRAEVERTRRKLYKQKGTGGARHGDRKAPIFVGGGIAFAPKPRDYSLSLSGKMKKAALTGALTTRVKDKNLQVVSGLDKLTGKTAELAGFLAKLEGSSRNLLIVTDNSRVNIYRAGRNIPGVTVLPFNQINTYEVLNADQILVMEEILEVLGKPMQTKVVGSEKPGRKVERKVQKRSSRKTPVKPKKVVRRK